MRTSNRTNGMLMFRDGRWSLFFGLAGRAAPGFGAVFVLAVAMGCQTPENELGGMVSKNPIAKVPLDPDIVAVKKFLSTVPWISFDPNNRNKPGGFKVLVYLISSKTQRGAFGDGIIRIVMSLAQRDETGKKVYREIRTWTYDTKQAFPYRMKKKNPVLGYAYGLRCRWEPEDDIVLGGEIAIRVDFERKDGMVLTAQPNILKPPLIQ